MCAPIIQLNSSLSGPSTCSNKKLHSYGVASYQQINFKGKNFRGLDIKNFSQIAAWLYFQAI